MNVTTPTPYVVRNEIDSEGVYLFLGIIVGLIVVGLFVACWRCCAWRERHVRDRIPRDRYGQRQRQRHYQPQAEMQHVAPPVHHSRRPSYNDQAAGGDHTPRDAELPPLPPTA